MKRKILRILEKILGLCARIYLKKNKSFIIWITWSVWKTSCRSIVSQTLEQILKDKKVYSSPKNFNSELGLVFSIFEIEKYSPGFLNLIKKTLKILFKTMFDKSSYDILVLEYWIDQPGDMDFLIDIVVPDISIFTKLDSIHEENFENIKAIWDEKFKLMKITKKIVYLNFKDEYCRNNYYWILREKKMYNNKDFKVSNWARAQSEPGLGFKSYFDFGDYKIETNILWEENSIYICIWLDIVKYLNPEIEIKKNLNLNYKMQAGRFSLFNWINNSILIDSTYNAWPKSMKKMIENAIKLRDEVFSDYKLWFVLWDMRELWINSDKLHKKIGNFLDKYDLVYTIWKEMKRNLTKKNAFLSSKEAWLKLKDFLKISNDKYLILFKWSQNTIFVEEALKQVLKDKKDATKLVRQSTYWMKQKEIFFNKI